MLQCSTQNNSWSQLPLLWPLWDFKLVFLIKRVHSRTILSAIYFSQTSVAATCIFGVSMIATCLQGKHEHWLYHKFGLTSNRLKIRVDWGKKRKQDIAICTLNLTKKARAKGEILRTHAHMRGKKARILPVALLLLPPFHVPLVHSQPAKTAASPRSSPLGTFRAGGTSATQREKFHTDDVNQCLHKKIQ